jgi:hypothetical protein
MEDFAGEIKLGQTFLTTMQHDRIGNTAGFRLCLQRQVQVRGQGKVKAVAAQQSG